MWRKHKCQIKIKQDQTDKEHAQLVDKADAGASASHLQIRSPHYLVHYEIDFVPANRDRAKVVVMDETMVLDSVVDAGVEGNA